MTETSHHPAPASGTGRPDGGSFGRRLAIVTALGALWRLGYLFVAKTDQKLLLNDSIYYSIQAGLNSEGSWFKDALTDQPGAEHGLLTSLYLTPWSLGAGDGVFRQRLGMTLLGIATVTVIGLLGRRLATPLTHLFASANRPLSGRSPDANAGELFASADRPNVSRRPDANNDAAAERVGITAAVIAAAYPNLWINDSLVMSETLALLLVSLSLLVALGHHVNPSVRSGIVLGVVVGLGALTRSEVALFVPGFALLSIIVGRRRRRRRRRPTWPAVAMVVTAVVTLLPWTIYNAGRFDEPVLLSTNYGNTLLGANCDLTYYDDIGGWDLRCLGPFEPGQLGHRSGAPDASERSQVRRDAALDYITDHLDRLPVVAVARLGRMLDLYGLGSMIDLDVGEEKAEWAVWVGIGCWWVLAVLAGVGWRVLRHRRVGGRWWLVVPIVAVSATTVLFYGAHRIRAPAEPSVVVLAAIAIVTWWDRAVAEIDGRNAPGPGGTLDV